MTFSNDNLTNEAATETAAVEPAPAKLVRPLAVRVYDFPEVLERTEKLNKRALKLGAEPVSVVEVRREMRKEYDHEGFARLDYFGNFIQSEWVIFNIEGARPKAAGWTLAARFDHSADLDAPVLKVVPGTPELASAYRTNERTRTCDHCRSARRRKDTFLVTHEDGREMVVGRQCIADFLGHDLYKLVPIYDAAAELCDEFEGFGGRHVRPVMLVTFLTLALADIKLNGGFRSRKAASEGRGGATADAAWCLAVADSNELKPEERAFIKKAEQYAPLAETIVAWAKAEYAQPKNDFEHNLRLAANAEVLPSTLSGVAAYIPVAWSKANEERVEKAPRPVSTHVGTVGKRMELGECSVVLVRYLESHFGTKTLIKARTADGSVVTWFASGTIEVETGATVTIKATIKNHESYKGEAQTVISRAVLTPVTKAE